MRHRYLNILVFGILLMLFPGTLINAETCQYPRSTFQYYDCIAQYDGEWVCPIHSNRGATGYAFCTDETVLFDTTQCWRDDPVFSDAKTCGYMADGQLKMGDCSQLAAHVVTAGNQNGGYYWAQAALWGYFAKFGPPGEVYQRMSRISAYNNARVQSIINTAFQNYVNSGGDADHLNGGVEELINVSGNSGRAFYDPDSDSYKVNKFSISSRQPNKRITVTITVSSDGAKPKVRIKKKNESNSQLYENGQPISIQLYGADMSSIDVSITSNEKFTFKVSATGERETRVTVLDSVRYHGVAGQGVLFISNKTVPKNNKSDYDYSVVPVGHSGCPNAPSGSYGKNTSSNPVGDKTCVNSAINKDGVINKRPPSRDKYVVDFASCDSKSISLGGGDSVRINIYENVTFRFGVLNPIMAYPGGGIRFAKRGESITTDYISKIYWEYADSINGHPYYYNADGEEDEDFYADRAGISGIINSKVDNMVKRGNLDLKFKTYDSNTNQATVVSISSPLTTVVSGGKWITKTDPEKGIQMNSACFTKVDGTEVKYGTSSNSDSSCLFDGGNKYYIPMKFGKSKFPFNIDTVNLSALSGGNFWYKADCEVQVIQNPDDPFCESSKCNPDAPPENGNSLYDNVRYRSIDVKNPFPKGNIQDNWKKWETDNSFRARLANSISSQTYPNNPLYSVNANFNQLGDFVDKDSYTSWENVNSNGSDNFVSSGAFSGNGTGSYCPIGQFKDSCDN